MDWFSLFAALALATAITCAVLSMSRGGRVNPGSALWLDPEVESLLKELAAAQMAREAARGVAYRLCAELAAVCPAAARHYRLDNDWLQAAIPAENARVSGS